MSPGGTPGGGGGSSILQTLITQFKTENADQLKQVLAAIQQQTSQMTANMNAMARVMVSGFVAVGMELKQTNSSLQTVNASIEKLTRVVGLFHMDYVNRVGQVNAATKGATKPVDELGAAFTRLGSVVNVALGKGVASIMGFVKQGMALGAQGQLMQLHLERLALTISGLFRPEIQKITDLIARFTDRLQRMSDTQRENIARWIQGAVAALAVGVVLPRVIAGVQALIGGFKALSAAMTGGLASTGLGAFLPLIGLIVQAMAAWLVGTSQGREALVKLGEATAKLASSLSKLAESLRLSDFIEDTVSGLTVMINTVRMLTDELDNLTEALNQTGKKENAFMRMFRPEKGHDFKNAVLASIDPRAWIARITGQEIHINEPGTKPKNRRPDIGRAGGFESLTATYERIARASVGARSPEERTAEATEETNRLLRENIEPALLNPRPEVVR